MYVPPHFSQHDPNEIRSFVRRHSFATLTSTEAVGEMVASHLPLLLDEQAGSQGTLVGHLARANPQWQSLEGQRVLVVFSGPHAYISPTWYAEPNTVPTWNYTAVHANGTCRLVHETAELLGILRDYAAFYEASLPEPWRFDHETEFASRMAAQVVGFRIEVSRWEGKWKLAQNHPVARRRRTIAALESQGDINAHEIAALMRATLPEEST